MLFYETHTHAHFQFTLALFIIVWPRQATVLQSPFKNQAHMRDPLDDAQMGKEGRERAKFLNKWILSQTHYQHSSLEQSERENSHYHPTISANDRSFWESFWLRRVKLIQCWGILGLFSTLHRLGHRKDCQVGSWMIHHLFSKGYQ